MAAEPAPIRGDRIPKLWRNLDMPRKINRLRQLAFEHQHGRCYYCKQTMWLSEPDAFARAHACSLRAAQWRRCTAEHLIARQDGGKNTADNIVAACRFCNVTRHRSRNPLPPLAFQRLARDRCRKGRWFRIDQRRRSRTPHGGRIRTGLGHAGTGVSVPEPTIGVTDSRCPTR